MRRRYHGPRGSQAHLAKLNERIIPVLRDLHRIGGITTRELGRGLGVNHTAIWQAVTTISELQADGTIVHRYRTWNHVR